MNLRKLLFSIPLLFLSAPAADAEPAIPVLEELRYTHQTSAMMPYYSIVRDGGDYLCRISPEEEGLRDRYSEVRVPYGEVAELLSRFMACGALSWDGYSVSKPRPAGMLDGDDSFSFSLRLRYAHDVKAEGSRSRPVGFREAEKALMEFFRTHQDYSRYYPRKFPSEDPDMLEIAVAPEFGNPRSRRLRLSLSPIWKQWAVELRDPSGEYVPKDVIVSDYRNGAGELPLREFLGLLRKYGFEAMNGTRVKGGTHEARVSISIHWGSLEYAFESNGDFEGREAFIREFVAMARDYYARVKAE